MDVHGPNDPQRGINRQSLHTGMRLQCKVDDALFVRICSDGQPLLMGMMTYVLLESYDICSGLDTRIFKDNLYNCRVKHVTRSAWLPAKWVEVMSLHVTPGHTFDFMGGKP